MASVKSNEPRTMSEGLLRQRRNLLVTSILLPLYFSSGAKLEEINLLGTKVEVSNPVAIQSALLGFFVYFLIRYWQYYKQDPSIDAMKRTENDYVTAREKSIFSDIAKKMIPEEFRNSIGITYASPRLTKYTYIHGVSRKQDRHVDLLHKEAGIYIYSKGDNGLFLAETAAPLHSALTSSGNWEPIGQVPVDGFSQQFFLAKVKYNVFRHYLIRVRAYLKYMINESCFTDFQLPFLVTEVALMVTLYATFI